MILFPYEKSSVPQTNHKEESVTPGVLPLPGPFLRHAQRKVKGALSLPGKGSYEARPAVLTASLLSKEKPKHIPQKVNTISTLTSRPCPPALGSHHPMRKCTRKHEPGWGVASGASIKSKHNILITWKPMQQSKLKIATQQEVHMCLQVGANIQGYLTHTRVLSAAQTFFQVLKLTAGSCEMEQEWVGVIRDGGGSLSMKLNSRVWVPMFMITQNFHSGSFSHELTE